MSNHSPASKLKLICIQLSGRPDLIEKFASLHPNGRYAMSGADNGMMLSAMKAGAAKCKVMSDKLQADN